MGARLRGWIADAGIGYDPSLIKSLNLRAAQASVADIGSGLLALSDPPIAIIALNEALCIDVIEELQRRGIRVPEEVVVTSFDLTAISKHFQPAFMTTDLDFGYMGEVACQKFMRLLRVERR